MSMIKINFSKISKMKKRASQKMRYYVFVSLVLFILSVFVISPSSIEIFILFSFFDAICGGLFAWNLLKYSILSILESVIEKID